MLRTIKNEITEELRELQSDVIFIKDAKNRIRNFQSILAERVKSYFNHKQERRDLLPIPACNEQTDKALRYGETVRKIKTPHDSFATTHLPRVDSFDNFFDESFSKETLEENHHKKRIEQLLWNGKYRTASRLIKYVNKDYQKLFEARIGLISFAGGVDDLIKKVPDQLKSDPGLVYDRIHWRIKKRKYDSALNLLLEINNTDSSKLVRPDKFWGKKNFLIRKLIDRHDYNTAYKLSINHGLKENKDIAEAEWMAGWISLTFLENPESAYLHFKEIWDVSSRPISKARAAYWMGNSLDALGKTDDAQKEYLKASKYSLTFYGQLAASKLNNKILFSPKLASKENTSSEKQEISNSVYLAISLLNEFDKSKLVKKFIWDLADREN